MTPVSITLETSSTLLTQQTTSERQRRHLLTEIPGRPDEYLCVLDNTAAEKIFTCHRSAEFYLVEERQAHAKDAALVYGGAIHEGLKAYLLNESLENQHNAIIKYFVDNPAPEDWRTVSLALEVLAEYRLRSRLPDYQWGLCIDHNGPIVERAFELPLGVIKVNAEIKLPVWESPRYVHAVHIAWSGRIDIVAHCNKRNRVVDHKTSSVDGEQFIQSFLLANQTIGYVWAARQLWPNLDIGGFCLNCLRLKRPSNGVGITEKGPRGGEPALKFFRCYYDYTPERVKLWERNIRAVISDFLHSLVRGYFPQQTTWCFNKFGKCQYHDVCTIEEEEIARRYLKGSAYKQVTWDPTL